MNVRKDAFAYSVWLVGCAALVVFAVSLPAADVKVPAGWTSETRTVKVASPDGDTDKEITYYKGRFKVPGKKNLQLEYVYIPAGKFIIGDPGEPDEQRPAEVAKGFLMSRCEVTQAQYKKVMGKNPSHFKNKPNNPVEKISWADASSSARGCRRWRARRAGLRRMRNGSMRAGRVRRRNSTGAIRCGAIAAGMVGTAVVGRRA